MARQFVVHLRNRVGELARLTRALAARGIDIRHVSVFGCGDEAAAFVIPSDDVAMRAVLHGMEYLYIEGEPLVVDIEDRPGGLADAAEKLASAGVLILGTMCVGKRPGFMEMAFTVDDEQKARAALRAAEREVVGAGA